MDDADDAGDASANLLDFITSALAGRQRGKSIGLPKPTAASIKNVRVQTGFDLAGFARILRGDDISHVRRSHGDPRREGGRDQKAIEKRDFTLIPLLVERASAIEIKGEAKAARPRRLIYQTEIDGQAYQYVETIHPREKVVALKSLLKR